MQKKTSLKGGAGGAPTRDQRITGRPILTVTVVARYTLLHNSFRTLAALLRPVDSRSFSVIIGELTVGRAATLTR
jgi:hypothetical protein